LAVRFEDLHLHLEKTMRGVAEWLNLPYRSSLLESTINGVPWVVMRGTNSWCGARAEQAARDLRYLSATDEGLLFAMLNESFEAWNYPYPRIFKHASVRLLTCALLLLIPMKMEMIAVRGLLKELSSVRPGGFRYAIRGLVQILICRFTIVAILAVDLCRRLAFGKKVARLSVIKVIETPSGAN